LEELKIEEIADIEDKRNFYALSILVDLPQIGGREQMGKRPAIIVQEEEYNLPTVLIVPLTTKLQGWIKELFGMR